MSPPDLAVIIVTWNVRALVLDALRSLLDDVAGSGLTTRVIVVDSASADGTVAAIRESFPQVDVIASEDNPGFAGGNNRGLRELGFGSAEPAQLPRAVYLLNPDTITQPGATRTLFDALCADPRVGVVGARLAFGDGTFQHSAFGFPGLRQVWAEFFPTPGRLIEGRFNGRYPRDLFDGSEPFPVDFVLGATFMLRREVIEQTGLFDEHFFMYCEEIDWQWRIRQAGWDICCVPTARVTHLGGQSTGQVRPQSVVNLWSSRLRLYAKHYPRWKVAAARWLIVRGMRAKIADEPDPALRSAYQQVIDLTVDQL